MLTSQVVRILTTRGSCRLSSFVVYIPPDISSSPIPHRGPQGHPLVGKKECLMCPELHSEQWPTSVSSVGDKHSAVHAEF